MADGIRDINFGLKVGYDEAASEASYQRVQDRVEKLDQFIRSKLKLRPDFSGGQQFEAKTTGGPARGQSSPASAPPIPPQRGSGATAIDRELDANLRARAKEGEAAEKAATRAGAATKKAADAQVRESARATAAVERESQRRAAADEKAATRAEAAVQKLAERQIRESQRAAEKQIQAANKAAEQAIQAKFAGVEKEVKGAQAAAAAADKIEQQRLAAIKRHEAAFDTAKAKIDAANSQVREGFERTTQGVLKLGRGIAMLGLVGEEDTKKILQAMLKVQGVIDLARGGIDIYRGISTAVSGYRNAVIAAAAAEKALAAARALSAGAGGVKGLGGAVGGLAGKLAGGAAGMAGAGSVGIGGAASAAGAVGAAAAPVAAFAAAVVGAAGAFLAIKDAATGNSQNINSFSMKVATAEVKFGEWVGGLARSGGKLTDWAAMLIQPGGPALMRWVKSLDFGSEAVTKMAEKSAKQREQRKEIDENVARDIGARSAADQQRGQAQDQQRGFSERMRGRQEDSAMGRADRAAKGDDPKAAIAAAQAAQQALDQGRLDREKEYASTRAATEAKVLAAEREIAEAQRTGAGSNDAAVKARNDAAARLLELDEEHFANVERAGQRAVQLAQMQVDSQQKLVDKAKELVTAAQKQADEARRGADEAERAVDVAGRAVAAARSNADETKKGYQEDLAAFGKMDAAKQKAVERAAANLKKSQGGQITFEEKPAEEARKRLDRAKAAAAKSGTVTNEKAVERAQAGVDKVKASAAFNMEDRSVRKAFEERERAGKGTGPGAQKRFDLAEAKLGKAAAASPKKGPADAFTAADADALRGLKEFEAPVREFDAKQGAKVGGGKVFAGGRAAAQRAAGEVGKAEQGLAQGQREAVQKNLESQEAQKGVAAAAANQKKQENLLVDVKSKVEVVISHNENLEKRIIDVLAPQFKALAARVDQAITAGANKADQQAREQANKKQRPDSQT